MGQRPLALVALFTGMAFPPFAVARGSSAVRTMTNALGVSGIGALPGSSRSAESSRNDPNSWTEETAD